MKGVTQRVQGKLLSDDGRTALLLYDLDPDQGQLTDILYLRFAFILRGVETPIFPVELLDDWGNAIKGWALYKWVLEYVDQFPRAEIFGFDVNGRETQYFLRDLEVMEPVRCYAYPTRETPLTEGALVAAVLLPTEGITSAKPVERPILEEIRPLSTAKVTWWQVPPTTKTFNF